MMAVNYQRAQTDEVVTYWRQIVGTLHQRGLLKNRPRRGGKILPQADAILLPDRCIFVLDMQRLAGIPKEQWQDHALWNQWRAALQGRRCFASDGGGLAITVARQPGAPERKRLPRVIWLKPDEHLPDKPYHITLGYTRRSPVTLDLAGDHRAILTGGTSGSGKTNTMQSIILQLAAKHTPADFQVAIVDTKEVDFGPTYARLPHLFAPIAHTLDEAASLVQRVEGERLRRQTVMAAAGVADWRKCDGLGLLVLLVDEAADFTRTATMATLVEIARKGRAFGVSLVLGTQSPSSRVIDPQVRANLPTAIAFQTRTDVESRVILGCKGAETLDRPGLALTFIGGQWKKVQTLRVGQTAAQAIVGQVSGPSAEVLSPVERDLVRYAVEHLDGAFTVGKLYQAVDGISKYALTRLARAWEHRGWLTEPARTSEGHKVGRTVTPELASLALGTGDHDIVTSVTRRDMAPKIVTRPAAGRDVVVMV